MKNAISAYTFIELRVNNENIHKTYMSVNCGNLSCKLFTYCSYLTSSRLFFKDGDLSMLYYMNICCR